MEFAQLNTIDATDSNLEATQEQPLNNISQVSNKNPVISSIDQPDMTGGLSMDDFYGLQSDNMGLEDLDDLYLDMF